MKFSIKRKISYVKRINEQFLKNRPLIMEKLQSVPSFTALYGENTVNQDAVLFEKYLQQIEEDVNNGITDEQAEAAWERFSKYCREVGPKIDETMSRNFPNPEDLKTVSAFSGLIKQYGNMFSMVEKHEKQVENVPENSFVFSSAKDPIPIHAEDFDKLFDNFKNSGLSVYLVEMKNKIDKLKELGVDAGEYVKSVELLMQYNDFSRGKGDENSPSYEQAVGAFHYLTANAGKLSLEIDKAIENVPLGGTRYALLQDVKTASIMMDDIFARVDAKGKIRRNRNTEMFAFDGMDTLKKDLDDYVKFYVDDDDDDLPGFEHREPGPKEKNLKELNSFVTGAGRHDDSFEIAINRIDAEINTLMNSLPSDMQTNLKTANGFDEFNAFEQKYIQASTNASNAHDRFIENTYNRIESIIEANPKASMMAIRQKKGLISCIVSCFDTSLFTQGDALDNVRNKFSENLKNLKSLKLKVDDQTKNILYSFVEHNFEAFNDIVKNMQSANKDSELLPKCWEIKRLQYERSIIANDNREAYLEASKRTTDALEKVPARSMRESLISYYRALSNEKKKTGDDSTEFKKLKEALLDAINYDNYDKLFNAATEYSYLKRKWVGPATSVGKARLSIATNLANLARLVSMNTKDPLIPEAEKDAPQVEIDFSDEMFEIIEDNIREDEEQRRIRSEKVPEMQRDETYDRSLIMRDDNTLDLSKMNFVDDAVNATYFNTGDFSFDTFHNDMEVFMASKLGEFYGFNSEDSQRISRKMINILDRNTTCNPGQDTENIKKEFIETFYSGSEEKQPVFSSRTKGFNIFLEMMLEMNSWYANAHNRRFENADLDYAEITRLNPDQIEQDVPDAEEDPRDRMRLIQANAIIRNLHTLIGNDDPEFDDQITRMISKREGMDGVRNLLFSMDKEGLQKLKDSGLRGENLTNALTKALSDAEQKKQQQQKKDLHELEKGIKDFQASQERNLTGNNVPH